MTFNINTKEATREELAEYIIATMQLITVQQEVISLLEESKNINERMIKTQTNLIEQYEIEYKKRKGVLKQTLH